jgi:hypothetical protein
MIVVNLDFFGKHAQLHHIGVVVRAIEDIWKLEIILKLIMMNEV